MVSYDPSNVLDYIYKHTTLLARGAESELRRGSLMGLDTVFKIRIRKPYMDPKLDSRLRKTRTMREAKVMAIALEAGVPAPRLYMVLPSTGLIAMEYIDGISLKEALWKGMADIKWAGRLAGSILGALHNSGIVHGDPTTSNYMVRGNDLILIDYGLSDFSTAVEDRAVDIHLFRRAVEATHTGKARTLFSYFLKGYRQVLGEVADSVIARVKEISLRGRYVEERRRSVWTM